MADQSNSIRTPDRSYAAYLQDVGGETDEEDFKRLDTSGSSAGDLLAAQITATPHNRSEMISPQLTEARSFANGLLSPFSPLLKQQDHRSEFLQYVSLQPCRKVSVVVRILPVDANNDEEQRCVFPHIKSEQNPIVRKPKAPRDMVVVNPSAFGKFIPSQVTMETARLVAQVANISSEDWARLYEFHHVMWPTNTTTAPGDEQVGVGADLFSTMDSLSRAVAQDALVEHQSSLVISMGQASSCIGTEEGVWPKIISDCQALMEEKTVCTLSMVELLEEKDSFRDLLNRKNKDVTVRHVDMKGAVLQGLTQVPLDSMPALLDALSKRRKGNTTVIGTLSLWENAVSHELNKSPSAQITCVELAGSARSGPSEAATNQKSAVSLGLALRQLLLHASVGGDPVISYRETTLTKVIQRALESSKIVLVASISQLSKDYESTVGTLNYLRRLLVQPGKTASSPFKSDSFEHIQDVEQPNDGNGATPSKLQEYAGGKYLLENLVADPRQRLAKILKKSPAQKNVASFEMLPAEEDYQPVDYMQGLENESRPQLWQSPTAGATGIPHSGSSAYSESDHDIQPQLETFTALDEEVFREVDEDLQIMNSTQWHPESEQVRHTDEVIGSTGWQVGEDNDQSWGKVVDDEDHVLAQEDDQAMWRPDIEITDSHSSNGASRNEMNREMPLRRGGHQKEPNEEMHVQEVDEEWNRDDSAAQYEYRNMESEEEPLVQRIELDQATISHQLGNSKEGYGQNVELAYRLVAEDVDMDGQVSPRESNDHEWLPEQSDKPVHQGEESNHGEWLLGHQGDSLQENRRERSLEEEDECIQQAETEEVVLENRETFHEMDKLVAEDAHEQDWSRERSQGRSSGSHTPTDTLGTLDEAHLNPNIAQHIQVKSSGSTAGEVAFGREQLSDGLLHDDWKRSPHVEGSPRTTHMDAPPGETNSNDLHPELLCGEEGSGSTLPDSIGNQSSARAQDQQNNSSWLNWNTDPAGDGGLDLEPETEYDLPEYPKKSHEQGDSIEWPDRSLIQDENGNGIKTKLAEPIVTSFGRYSSPLRKGGLNLRDSSRKESAFSSVQSAKNNRGKFALTNVVESPREGRNRPHELAISPVNRPLNSLKEESHPIEYESISKSFDSLLSRSDSEFTGLDRGQREGPSSSSRVADASGSLRLNRRLGERLELHRDSTVREVYSHSAREGDSFHTHRSDDAIETNPIYAEPAVPDHESTAADLRMNTISTSGAYNEQIETLEGAVNQIQNMHTGLWKSSALSLHQLKDSLQTQQSAMIQLVGDREELQSVVAGLKDDMRKVSEEHENRLQLYEEEVQRFQDRLDRALHDKSSVEKIAEEAISAHDSLERKLSEFQDEVRQGRRQADATLKEYESVAKANAILKEDFLEAKLQVVQLKSDKEEGGRLIYELEISGRRLEEHNSSLQQELRSDRSSIEELTNQIRRDVISMQYLEDEKCRLEALRKEDKSQLEGLQSQSRRFGASLDNMEEERSRLEDLRSKDQSVIKDLRGELREIKVSFESLKLAAQRSDALSKENESKVEILELESKQLSATIDNSEGERKRLEKVLRGENTSSEYMKQEIRQLRLEIEKLQNEQRNLSEGKHNDNLKIQRLASELCNEAVKREELEKKQLELSRLKKKHFDMQTSITRQTAEHFELVKRRDEEIALLQMQIHEQRQELSTIQDRANAMRAKAGKERQGLQETLEDFKTELDACQKQRDDFALKLEVSGKKESNLARRLKEKDEAIQRHRREITSTKEEHLQMQEKEMSKSIAGDHEIKRLQKRLLGIGEELVATKQQRDNACSRVDADALSREKLSHELKRATDRLSQEKVTVERLSRDLLRADGERRKSEENILKMESTLRRFQLDTKEKVGRVLNHHTDSSHLLETANFENRRLEEEKTNLQAQVVRLQRERDACYRSLEVGRDRLAQIASKSSDSKINGSFNVHGASDVPTAHMVPELYLTEYSAGHLLSLRAEEIAACLAMTAKHSLQESQDETTHLRSQVYILEEAKQAEVDALKSKIHSLQQGFSP